MLLNRRAMPQNAIEDSEEVKYHLKVAESKKKISRYKLNYIYQSKFHVLQSSLIPFVVKRESDREVTFLINNLPKPGFYKLQLFAR